MIFVRNYDIVTVLLIPFPIQSVKVLDRVSNNKFTNDHLVKQFTNDLNNDILIIIYRGWWRQNRDRRE